MTYKFANKPSLTFDFTNASIALEVAMRHWTNYADVTTELVQEGKADIEINFVDPRNKTPAEEYALAYALAPVKMYMCIFLTIICHFIKYTSIHYIFFRLATLLLQSAAILLTTLNPACL